MKKGLKGWSLARGLPYMLSQNRRVVPVSAVKKGLKGLVTCLPTYHSKTRSTWLLAVLSRNLFSASNLVLHLIRTKHASRDHCTSGSIKRHHSKLFPPWMATMETRIRGQGRGRWIYSRQKKINKIDIYLQIGRRRGG